VNHEAARAAAQDLETIASVLSEDFSLTAHLDTGGQGAVFGGYYRGASCALKVYFPGQVERRVEREVVALRKIDCPTIVRLLWAGDIQLEGCRLPVVATEFIEGSPLRQSLAGAADDERLGALAYDVSLAIEALWNRRIVHRDLKPENILIRPNGRACVIDLGVARHLDETSLTAHGLTWGTRGYMSPEQARGVRQLTCKSDLFALGVILIEVALGRHPTGRDQGRLLSSALHKGLPAGVRGCEHEALIKLLLQPKPYQRPLPRAVLSGLSSYSQLSE